MLGTIAAHTKRIRLGTAVSVLSWHHPLEVAQDLPPWTCCLMADSTSALVGVCLKASSRAIAFSGPRPKSALMRVWISFSKRGRVSRFRMMGNSSTFRKLPSCPTCPSRSRTRTRPCGSPASVLRPWRGLCAGGGGITPALGASLTPLPELKERFGRLETAMKKPSAPIFPGSAILLCI